MEKVTVTATQTHAGRYGIIAVGDKYETDKNHAQELVNNGVVTSPGIKAAGEPSGFVSSMIVNEKEQKEPEKEKVESVGLPTAKSKKK